MNSWLHDRQWELVSPLFEQQRRPGGRGRPPKSRRSIFEGLLCALSSGIPWRELPSRFPSASTCWRYWESWRSDGRLQLALERLAEDFVTHSDLELDVLMPAPNTQRVPEPLPRSPSDVPNSWRYQTASVLLSPRNVNALTTRPCTGCPECNTEVVGAV